MLFKKKKEVRIELLDEGDVTKLIIDYFNKKGKQEFRTELLRNLLSREDNFLMMVDTNFFSKMEAGYEREWAQNFKEWLAEDDIKHQIMKAKKESPTGVVGSLFNMNKDKKNFFAFRIGAFTDAKEFDTLIGYHDQVKMGLHVGIGIKKDDVDFLLREYCAGLIDEYNRFEFYEVDIYDYLEVGRMVIHSDSFEKITAIKTWVHEYLGE